MGFTSQLGLVLWKNWTLQKRRMCVTIFEIIMPIFFAVLLVLIRSAVEATEYSEPTYYFKTSVADNTRFSDTTTIGYSPNNTATDSVMAFVLEMLQNRTQQNNVNFSTIGFPTEDIALEYISSHTMTMQNLIVFADVSDSDSTLPKNLDYTIRPSSNSNEWYTDTTFAFYQTNGPRDDSTPDYQGSGFLYLQALVAEGVAKHWISQDGGNPDSIYFGVYDQRMAYPPYFDDPLIEILQYNLPLFLVLSFIVSVIINTKNLVYEKEQKLKESMKLMGLRASVHWISWFIMFAVYMVFVMAIYALLYGLDITEYGPVLAKTDPTVFFVFLLCYGIALIAFCFMVSTFAQKANIGAALAGILFFGTFFPYYFVQPYYESLNKATKLAAGLLLNTGMSLGTNVIGIYEGTGEGAQWDNFYEPGVVDDNLSLLDCMLLLLFDAVLYFLIAWYLDNIWPGEFGVPKPYCFCFSKSYWTGDKDSLEKSYDFEQLDSKHFEKDPTGLRAGIQISQLRKEFDKKVAVEGTSLKMYDGQITVLLGHNGAGKTTTMSMLTGFIPPTSGTAQVNGCDIREDIQGVRSSLGLCPQHNILFGTLTVKEHLVFFAKLKGSTGGKVEEQAINTAKEVGLEAKLHFKADSLSGGQKRKLSVGIALIGGSKVVILDEPTSGMDPAARRQTWNVLQNARKDRTIVLSTHYMDEADLLGDRIAIMAEGVVKCCGTSLFLKKLYGAGYHLVVVKRPDCDIDTLTQVIQSHISSAELETVINTEVTFLLPDSESARFPALFNKLEDRKEQLGITSFGTTATTMEEVFLKVGEYAHDNEDDVSTEGENSSDDNVGADGGIVNRSYNCDEKTGLSSNEKKYGGFDTVDSTENNGATGEQHIGQNGMQKEDTELMNIKWKPSKVGPTPETIESSAFNKGFVKNTGLTLVLAKMRALFVKKMIITLRSRIVTLVQLLLPVFFTIIGMATLQVTGSDGGESALVLNLDPYGTTYIPYTDGLNPTSADEAFAQLYNDQFSGQTMEYFSMPEYPTFDNYTLERAEVIGTTAFNEEMIIGMEVIDPSGPETFAAVSHYNGQPYHGEPVAMNYLMNTFLQSALNASFSLQSTLYPLPKDAKDTAEDDATAALSAGFSIGFFINFGMAFLTTMFIYFLIKERQVGAKHMQVVSGVGPVTYWLPTFLWDFINYIIPSMLLLVVFAAYQEAAYLDDGRWALVIFVLVMYGWAVLPYMYALQFAFNSPPTGVVIVIVLNIITGLVAALAVYILLIPGLGTEDIGNTLDWLFMCFFPNYNMAACFSNIYTNYLNLETCADVDCSVTFFSTCCQDTCEILGYCTDFETNYLAFDKPGIGSYISFLAIQGFASFFIVFLIEYHICQKIWYLITGSSEDVDVTQVEGRIATEDNDVAAENQRIHSYPASVLSAKDGDDSLILMNLYKRYGTFIAVDHVTVGVPEQECFGLLGQNGAGKTTTFKMLTGDVMVTGGNAYLKGFDVRSDIKQVQGMMGYCPQFDALIDQMTGRETLTMYARLRGVPEENLSSVVDNLIEILMLRPHADKLAGQYSGGNKRKLSTAMALVGDPPFIMLDEPSSGMDPKARRQLWNVLSQVRASGRTLVLTSHSMEECDALCTRIAIMVNGRFVCLGSPQHLKNKFGQGYTLIVQMGALPDGTTAPNQPIVDYIVENFPGAKVFDDHQGYIHFQVPDSGVKLAQVFSLMEQAKQTLYVQDYSVHQTTLEQVFLTFTRSQVPPKEDKSKSCMTRFCCFCCM